MQTLKEMLKISESEQILIDKNSGKITFPNRVTILKHDMVYSDITKSAVYVISEALKMNKNTTAKLYFDNFDSQNYEIYFGTTLCVNKRVEDTCEDILYYLNLEKKGVKTVYFINVDFNKKGTYFYDACCTKSVKKIIETYSLRALKPTVKERVIVMRQAQDFNVKLDGLKRFSFNGGNSFCGIKKLVITFDGEVKVQTNGNKNLDLTLSKEEILSELKLFYFSAWKNRYEENKNPKLENAWSITLKFEGEELEFLGLDDYPKNWQYVEHFIKKYGGFEEIRE